MDLFQVFSLEICRSLGGCELDLVPLTRLQLRQFGCGDITFVSRAAIDHLPQGGAAV
jgi:hypothetical protein